MGLIIALTLSAVAWIVLFALNFGRSGDAFFITVFPMLFIAVAVYNVQKKSPKND